MTPIIRSFIFLTILLSINNTTSASKTILDYEGRWESKKQLTFTPTKTAMGDKTGLTITLPPSDKSRPFTSATYTFTKIQDWTNVESTSYYAKASAAIKFKITYICEGGYYYTNWGNAKIRRSFSRHTNLFHKMKKHGTPDLSKIKAINVEFGLFTLANNKQKVIFDIADFRVNDLCDKYIIPKPTTGVSIDGSYRDWGFEDVLYNWTPPSSVKMDNASFLSRNKENWQDKNQLSGRFSFMKDSDNLYFLAIVADQSPFEGGDIMSPYKNDSIELFICPNITERNIRNGASMRKLNGLQVVYDCGKNYKQNNVLVFCGGTEVKNSKIKTSIIPASQLINGKQSPGYILESAIPLDLLPESAVKRGSLLGYSLLLNDTSELSLNLSPTNTAPYKTVKDFRKAYIELEVKKKKDKIVFPAPAINPFWPKKYLDKEADFRIWDMGKAYRETVSSTTKRIYLNSLWAVQAVGGENASPQKDKWLYMPLPMGIGWYTPVFGLSKKNKDYLSSSELGYGRLCKQHKNFFWYERQFKLSSTNKDKKTYLCVDYLYGEINCYLNGAYVGMINMANRSLDISDKVKFDQENRIDLLLFTNINLSPSLGNGRDGITGNIYLKLCKHKPVVNDFWIKEASGINGSFEFIVESTDPDDSNKLTLNILNKNDKSLKITDESIRYDKNSSAWILKGICKNFTPWSPESPNLNFANLQIYKDGRLIEDIKKRFGFRSFEIKNGKFLLNGKILRLRQAYASDTSRVVPPGRMKILKKYGYNSLYMHSATTSNYSAFFNHLDETGMLVFAPLGKGWGNKRTIDEVRRFRNHPSVIGYSGDPYGQLTINGFIHNPFCVSDTYYPESRAAIKTMESLKKRAAVIKSTDPTKPYIPHATGNFDGAFKNIHHYPCFGVTLLDRILYFKPWSERANPLYPLYLFEGATRPLIGADLTHPDHKFPIENNKMVDRLIFYENASRYLGDKAFDNWQVYDKLHLKNSIRGFRTCGVDAFNSFPQNEEFLAPYNTKKALGITDRRQLSYKYFMLPFNSKTIEDTWMRMTSWYYRLRALAYWEWPKKYGQGAPEKDNTTIYTSIYENEMQSFFAYIGGRADEFFAKSHCYVSGEIIYKQIIAINDTESDYEGKATISLIIGKNSLKQSVEIAAKQGEILKLPIQFQAPTVSSKTSGLLKLSYPDPDGNIKYDEFAITLFPKKSIAPFSGMKTLKVASVLGANKDSILKKANIKHSIITLTEKIPSDIDLLVLERNALTKDIKAEFLKDYIDKGGQVLLFEQSNKGLLDWRLKERRLEALFIANQKHPIVNNLSNSDLAYFRGPSTIISNEKRPSKYYRHAQAASLDTPHLTNVGIVAAYVMSKPCYGRFTPILVGGYDQEEVALLEARSGKGRVIFCQVDVTGRYGIDPVATTLTNNLFDYLQNTPVQASPKPINYIGESKGRKMLEQLGITISEMPTGNVLVIGDNCNPSKEILSNYKTVVVLPVSDFIPQGLKTQNIKITAWTKPHFWKGITYTQFEMLESNMPSADRLIDKNNMPKAFEGLVDNDFYFFECPFLKSYSLLSGNNQFKIKWHSKKSTILSGVSGNTNFLLCSINPFTMKHGECQKKACRIWSQIFFNLNAPSKFKLPWQTPAFDISGGKWTFLTDPDSIGEKAGFQNGIFGDRIPRKIELGKIWEEQGVNDQNPNIHSDPDSAYDGFGWYFRTIDLPNKLNPQRTLYFELGGVRDIPTFSRHIHQTTLWINGRKMPQPIAVYNAKQGGRAGRLWEIPKDALKPGTSNFIAIQIFNTRGAGGIHMRPARFEYSGQNRGMLFPYQFIKSKYNPYYFWCW